MHTDPRLDELLSLWQRHQQRGEDVPAEELCRDCPELLPQLQAIQRMERLAEAGANGSPEHTIDHPTGPFEQVVSLCEDFVGKSRAADRPSIQSYLDRVGADAQPSLFRNLLVREIENRRAAGEQPRVEDYLERFPQFADQVRAVFLELSSAVSSFHTQLQVKPKLPALKVPAARRLGDYQLLSELGRGGMGVVYEAYHLQRGNHVGLKTLPSVDGSALHRFKREFRALAHVNHPNLIGLHTLEADGNQWFFTMDLIVGTTFLNYVRPDGRLDEARLRSALGQLVAGVMALHGHHTLHRDLKPSNVMVTNEGHVVVLDFGLVLELDNGQSLSQSTNKVAGTPGYMAPEQAAGSQVTAASDWYAVGVMLYESLCGKLPFSGNLLQVLQDKQRRDPPPLPEDAAIPADLAALCLRLLARDPKQRPDALGIARAMAASVAPTAPTVAPGGQHLVGRDQHLAALQEALRQLERQRDPLTVFISGRSGEGKSTLGEHFLAPLRRDHRLAVMSGRCYDRESVPFKALDNLIDALASYLRSLPREDAALLMPDDIGALVQVFPVLQRVEVVARATDARLAALDEQQIRQRAFRALRSLLTRISRRLPVIWFIDDLQWGDADSAAALFEVLRPPEAPAVLFLGAYRSDETEGSAFLQMWQELQRKHGVEFHDREVKLTPLTVAECTELVIGLLGQDNDRIRQRAAEIAEETRGNPFLLTELVGCFDPDTESFQPVPLHEVLARKLGRLPGEAELLLEVVAVSGQALALAEAARTAGHELPPVATLTRMRNERLVRLIGPEESPLIDTYHDRIRETVLGRLDGDRCQFLHRTLAEVIEKDMGGDCAERLAALEGAERSGADAGQAIPRVYDLAYHFDAAGEVRKGWGYALLAAEQARCQSALEVAANNYALAKRNAAGASAAMRYRVAVGYGAVLMLLGRYEDATEQLRGVADLVEDAESKARIELLQGEIAIKQGAVDKSIAIYESGLRRLGVWVPRSRFGLFYGVIRESVIQGLHSLFPFLRHRKTFCNQGDLAIYLSIRISAPSSFQNTTKMLWSHLVGLNRAELLPPSPRLVHTYAVHGMVMAMLGWQGRGNRFGDRALAIADEFDDVWGYGNSCNYTGIGLYASARYQEGLLRLTEAITAFEKAGDLWEAHMAHFHKGCCHFGLGDLAAAVAEARWTFASSARLGDSRVLCSSYLWARATRGNIPFEELRSCYPCRPDDIMSTVHGIMAEGHWHTFHGRTAESLQAFEKAAAMIRKSFCVNSHTIVVVPELTGALRRQADALQQEDARQAAHLRLRAYRLAKWATRFSWLFPATRPQALRERSLILAAYGKTWKALKFAKRSCAVAEKQQAKYEYAQSLLVRGRLAKQLGRVEAEEQIRTAEAALAAMEKAVTVS